MDSKSILNLCGEAFESNQAEFEALVQKIVSRACEKAESQGAELWSVGLSPDANLIASRLTDVLLSCASYQVISVMVDYAMPKVETD